MIAIDVGLETNFANLQLNSFSFKHTGDYLITYTLILIVRIVFLLVLPHDRTSLEFLEAYAALMNFLI